MAATVTALGTQPSSAYVPGARRHLYAKVAFDSSYPTGGYALTPAMFGLVTFDAVMVAGTTQAGRPASFTPTGSTATSAKVRVFSAVTTEIASTTDLSADAVHVHVIGN